MEKSELLDCKVILVSKNEISREGLSRIISDGEFDVIQTVMEASRISWSDCPEDVLILMDIDDSTPLISDLNEIHLNRPSAKCVILAEKFEFNQMVSYFQHNARGYLIKNMPCTPLIASLRLVALGELVMPSSLVEVLFEEHPQMLGWQEANVDIETAHLSQREMDVLCCLMAGQSNKLIARRLDLSEATVKVHVKAILRKIKVDNRTQAAMWATANRVPVRHSSGQWANQQTAGTAH